MRIICLLFIISLLSVQPVICDDGPFKLIKTIGDDRENYTIFGLGDAILTENKDIFILNVRGNYIAQYDWDGKFIRNIGQKGQGPQDFYFPRSLFYSGEKLYVHDRGNRRIAEMDLKTNKFEYYKENLNNRFSRLVYASGGKMFLGVFRNIKKNRGRIGIMDENMNIRRSFFDKYPIEIDIDDGATEFQDTMTVEKAVRTTVLNTSFEPVCDYDELTNEILVSFRSPDNPVRFFVYNTEGKLLKEFSYTIEDKKYKFSRFFLDTPRRNNKNLKKWPPRFEVRLPKLYIYRDHYIAFLALHDLEKKEIVKRQYFCLVFNRAGKLVKRFLFNSKLSIIRHSNGFFLASIWEEEITKLYIYQLDFKKMRSIKGDKL